MTGVQAPGSSKRQEPGRGERTLVIILIAALLGLGSVFLSPAVCGRIPIHGDLGRATLPMRHFYARSLQQGEALDWMPELYGGYFASGAGGQGFYHPVNLLLYRFLPFDLAVSLEVFWPLPMLALGMVVFLRRYVDLTGACLGSLAASFSLLFIQYLHTPPMVSVLAHIPWFLAALDMALSARTAARRWLACAAIALVTGSQVLQGFPQALWYALLSGAIFTLCLFVMRRAPWQSWLAALGGVLLGMCIGAAELLTMYSMFATSTRADTDRSLLPFPPLDPWSFHDLFVPCRTWNSFTVTYFGAAPLVLVLWWMTACHMRPLAADDAERWRRVRQLTIWAFLLGVVTALLSMGLKAKFYYLQLWLPLVGSFRAPCRIFIVTQFSVGILAGAAFDRLVRIVRNRRKTAWRHLMLPWLAVVAAIGFALWFDSHAGSWLPQHWNSAVGPLLIGGSALALTLAARGRRAGLLLLILITIGDLGYYSVANPVIGGPQWGEVIPYKEFVSLCSGPPTTNGGRLLYTDRRDGCCPAVDCLCLSGCRTINGYSALYPLRRLDYSDANTLRVADVAWIWQPMDSHLPPPWGPQRDGVWRRLPDPLPRARLVSKAKVTTVPAEDLKKIDVNDTALATRHLDLEPSRPGIANIVEDRPGRITVAAEAPRRQLLVVSESYQDGWHVRVDGMPAVLEQVNGDFIGCVVAAGKHRVELQFAPAYVRLGRKITLASLAVALGMIVIAGFHATWPRTTS